MSIWNLSDMQYHKLVKTVNSAGVGSLFIMYIFSTIVYVVKCCENIAWLWALPIYLIPLITISYGMWLDSERNDYWENRDRTDFIENENKKLKKIIKMQSKMKNINVL